MLRIVVPVLVLVACSSSSTGSLECEAVLGPAIDRLKAESRAAASDHPDVVKVFADMKKTISTHCREDGWTQATLACMKAARDSAEWRVCERKHFTIEQKEKVHSAIDHLAEPVERERVAQILARMTKLKDRMCACTDAACAKDVSAVLEAYGKELATKPAKKMTDEETQRTTRLGEELGRCMSKAYAAPGSAALP